MTDWTRPDDYDPWAGMPDYTPTRDNPHAAGSREHAEWDQQRAAERAAHEQATAAERELRRARLLAEETERHLIRLKARELATALYAAEQSDNSPLPAGATLTDFLNQPFEDAQYRIDGLWPRRGNVVLSAAYKAGKTSLRDNLIRVLVDGGRFLGLYPVEQIGDGRVAVIDFEMPPNKLQEWWRDQQIRNTDNVMVWTLRGRARLFDPRDPQIRARWVEALKQGDTRVLILDCLGPILSALGLNENDQKEVGGVLDGIVSLATEAGVDEVLLIHHMGHGSERSRGASRLRDWPDAEWRLVRQKDEDNPWGDPDPSAPRFFAAFGRDVNIGEGQLVFDPATRRLVFAEGNRKQARTLAAMAFVVGFVRDHPGSSVRAIQEAAIELDGPSRDASRDAIKAAIGKGYLSETLGPNRARMHSITSAGFSFLASPYVTDGPDDGWQVTCVSCGGQVNSDEAIEFATDRCRRCRERRGAA